MNNEDALRISQQRDAIYEWVIERFRVQMSENDIDGALALADEFFEWMDPDNLDNEQTFFINENDLKQRYEELTRS